MRINSLYLENFRNYAGEHVDFDPVCNVIWGENAQGKTNLLEAICCLSCGKSPRTRGDKELIRFDTEGFRVEGNITSRDRTFVSKIESFRGRKKKITVNGVPAKSAAALGQVLNTVFFAPEDLQIIRAGASERRKFMDVSLCQLRPRYEQALSEYNRLYDHKVRILRDWQENLSLAVKVQREMNTLWPTLARPIGLRENRYNQQTTTGSLLVEIGAHGNTLQEALAAARCFARAAGAVLLAYK